MKVILSRKGFDSKNGGIPSPILPTNELISFPIPSIKDSISFGELKVSKDIDYYTLISSLQKNRRKDIIQSTDYCHLDPDIYPKIIKREKNWRPLFGQAGASQTHLLDHSIKPGDLFLFFGWFRHTVYQEGVLLYDENRSYSLHIIFGYFQIGKIIAKDSDIENWMNYHPHCNPSSRIFYKNNCIYVARKNLSWNENLPGSGPFKKYKEELVLTKKKPDGNYLSRSKWFFTKKFPFGKKIDISYHDTSNWKKNFFQSANIGQEFILEEITPVEDWAKEMVISNFTI